MKHIRTEGVVTAQPENYSDCRRLITSDFYRYLGRTVTSPLKLWLLHFKEPGMGFLYYFRLCQHRGWAYPYLRLRMEKYARKYGIRMSREMKLGYGLYLGHGMDVVVNPTAIIGSNIYFFII